MATMEMPDVANAVHSEAHRLRDYLAGLDAEAWDKPSACVEWKVAEVAAHLAQGAETWVNVVTRAVAGDSTAPPGVQPTPGGSGSESIAQRAISFRSQIGDSLLQVFDSNYERLHQLLTGLQAEDWDKPCWHPRGVLPIRSYVGVRVQELILHGWDIRSSLEGSAAVSEECLPIVVGMVPRWLENAFRPPQGLPPSVRFRFDVPGPVPVHQDIVVGKNGMEIETPGDVAPDVTLHCDTSTYVLLAYGRVTIQQASAAGSLSLEGSGEQAALFSTWFRGF